jgi:energy-coupling factor transport system ATP-binding protein
VVRKQQPLNVREGRAWLASLPAGISCDPAGRVGQSDGQNDGQSAGRVGQSDGQDAGQDAGRVGQSAGQSDGQDVGRGAEDGSGQKPLISAHDIWFRYDKGDDFVLKGLETEILDGEIHMYVGGNGSGKSTLLGILGGVFKPFKGKVRVPKDKKRCMLFQDPKAVFVCDTLLDDLVEHDPAVTKEDAMAMADRLRIGSLLHRHPYDLSAGEMQKAAIAKVLLLKPDILLLDEPIKGLDAFAKREIADILTGLKQSGVTIVMVTHDIEFAAEYADRCSMVFGNAIIASGGGREFFRDNMFYTTSISRMTRGLAEGCILESDVVFEGVSV